MKRAYRTPGRPLLRVPALVLAVLLTLTACDTGDPIQDEAAVTDETVETMAAQLRTDLQLEASQVAEVQRLMAQLRAEGRTPGALWALVAQMHERLNETQRARLQALMERLRDEAGPRQGKGHRRGMRRGGAGMQRHGGPGASFMADLLTEDQREAFAALRDQHRTEVEELRRQRQEGSLTEEAFFEQLRALREEMRAAVQGLLTDEQRDRLAEQREARRAERQEAREARRQAMAEALGLTAEQQAALDELAEAHHAAMTALREAMLRGERTPEELHAERRALMEAHRQAVAEILTPEQQEVMALHHLLTHRLRRHAATRQGGHAGQGPGRRFRMGPPGQ